MLLVNGNASLAVAETETHHQQHLHALLYGRLLALCLQALPVLHLHSLCLLAQVSPTSRDCCAFDVVLGGTLLGGPSMHLLLRSCLADRCAAVAWTLDATALRTPASCAMLLQMLPRHPRGGSACHWLVTRLRCSTSMSLAGSEPHEACYLNAASLTASCALSLRTRASGRVPCPQTACAQA